MMGESPTRPHLFACVPPVEVPAARFPARSRATTPTVPYLCASGGSISATGTGNCGTLWRLAEALLSRPVGPQWELRPVLARRDWHFALALSSARARRRRRPRSPAPPFTAEKRSQLSYRALGRSGHSPLQGAPAMYDPLAIQPFRDE